MFGNPASSPGFGTPSTPSFTPAFGSSPFFSTPANTVSPFSQQPQQQQQQQTPSPFSFQTPTPSSSHFGAPPAPSPFMNPQLTTQMAPVAPLPFSLADRDIQAIVDAYKDEPGNPKYAFKHLLFSVTDPAFRAKPVGVSDIMWAEAMGKLEGMESSDRERLWPQLVQGFKDLSHRLKLQDEAITSDAERLQMTQTNVKMLQRHFQADTLPWIQRMKQKEQGLQRRLLRVMRIVEALEGKGFRVPLTKAEVELAEKLATIARQVTCFLICSSLPPLTLNYFANPTCGEIPVDVTFAVPIQTIHKEAGHLCPSKKIRQLKGPGAELARRVHHLLSVSRVHANVGVGGSIYLPGSTKIHEQSLADMQEVLQQQTEGIARLGSVLKRDVRDMEIMTSEDTDMADDGGGKVSQSWPTASILR
ncbi:nuclear pore complex protein NUP54 [Cinnamomum micranthum f. kanehirae]|uniref:Nuclear pore complex protein NUP54 n=1 Tax=Cinnamomum micranthum f. kanehirae TaxID=337451 RepID=A0A3S3LZX6_9MAGN|nr:nuclear pore complex protein NUP54 [Cinnamomum micranthum f. kanehirae]